MEEKRPPLIFTLLNSVSRKPLWYWSKTPSFGKIRRISDLYLKTLIIELTGIHIDKTFISSPPCINETLSLELPCLDIVIKNLKQYMAFEWQILDSKGIRRRFRACNYRSVARVTPALCIVPMRLVPHWNRLRIDLNMLSLNAYGTQYVKMLRISMHSNCHLRRITLADRFYTEEDMPSDLRLTNLEEQIERKVRETRLLGSIWYNPSIIIPEKCSFEF
ncbi:cilia- and flagella-associated protein 20-like [Teleopsis dalmanni]|uniref:cilia- and flagella-associated protein 20-like n=1 Tax=Teleopsis dalmanni TaxID=139649 RepID=UPI0018CD153B|nr:cilia- and flagella-associated protein 20-like [Teleopsis dalmanni]